MIRFSYFAADYKCPKGNPIVLYLNSLLAAEARRFKGQQDSTD